MQRQARSDGLPLLLGCLEAAEEEASSTGKSPGCDPSPSAVDGIRPTGDAHAARRVVHTPPVSRRANNAPFSHAVPCAAIRYGPSPCAPGARDTRAPRRRPASPPGLPAFRRGTRSAPGAPGRSRRPAHARGKWPPGASDSRLDRPGGAQREENALPHRSLPRAGRTIRTVVPRLFAFDRDRPSQPVHDRLHDREAEPGP